MELIFYHKNIDYMVDDDGGDDDGDDGDDAVIYCLYNYYAINT